MYVTLEPCAHEGRQPPCVEAILEAGIERVVIASDDPSEKASGRGPGMLRDGGIEVEFATGEEATAARLLNQPFRKHARTGLPLVTLKLAMSLDGQTETPPGDSPWISGREPTAGPPLARRIGRSRRRHRHRPGRRPPAHLASRPFRCALCVYGKHKAHRNGSAAADSRRLRPPGAPPARLSAPADARRVAGPCRHIPGSRPIRRYCPTCRRRRDPRRGRDRRRTLRSRPSQHHQPLPRGRRHSCGGFRRSRPDRRVPHLRRPDPARGSGVP